jgi:alpha-beta hydrolase superfamily lysophospholipase
MPMRRVMRFFSWLAAILILVLVVGWWASRPATPGEFYAMPASLASTPGTLLRKEPFETDVPPGAIAWRILYSTTRTDGAPGVASAIVMTSRAVASAPRPIIAWAHGTTGIVPGCAPSVLSTPFQYVPALDELIGEGWIYVATDYAGQGTQGPHAYLMGEGEARSILDSVRAARHVEGVIAGERTVVWGHSQGGHAAMWTGILAPAYAPDVRIDGVAAIAPATDLPGLIERIQHTPIGRMMTSYTLRAYSEAFPDVSFDAYSSGWSNVMARDMAGRCIAGFKTLFSVVEALAAGGTIFATSPTTGPLAERLVQNVPDRPIEAPLLIAQGVADDLVLPDVQARFVKRRCEAGQSLEYRRYAARDHVTVVGTDSPLTRDLVQWTRDRISGVPAASGCHDELR